MHYAEILQAFLFCCRFRRLVCFVRNFPAVLALQAYVFVFKAQTDAVKVSEN